MKIIIQSPELKPRQSLIDFVTKKIEKLEQYSDRIHEARVLLKLETSDSGANKVCEVRLAIPGNDLFAKRQATSFEEASKEVMIALRKQLKQWSDKMTAHKL